MEYVIDAAGKPLGRIASQAALVLQGKQHVTYDPRLSGNDRVVIMNVAQVVVTGDKSAQKIYRRHTGYMGHLRQKKYREIFTSSPQSVMMRAIYNMLPKNRLRRLRMARIVIKK